MLLEVARKEKKLLPGVPPGGAPRAPGAGGPGETCGAPLASSCSGRVSAFRTIFDGFAFQGTEVLAHAEWGVHVLCSGLRGKQQEEIKTLFGECMGKWETERASGGGSMEGLGGDGAGEKGTKQEDHEDVKFIWIDDDRSFVVLPEKYREMAEKLLVHVGHTCRASAMPASETFYLKGIRFSPVAEWLQATPNEEGTKKRQGDDVRSQPAAKRQRMES